MSTVHYLWRATAVCAFFSPYNIMFRFTATALKIVLLLLFFVRSLSVCTFICCCFALLVYCNCVEEHVCVCTTHLSFVSFFHLCPFSYFAWSNSNRAIIGSHTGELSSLSTQSIQFNIFSPIDVWRCSVALLVFVLWYRCIGMILAFSVTFYIHFFWCSSYITVLIRLPIDVYVCVSLSMFLFVVKVKFPTVVWMKISVFSLLFDRMKFL